MGPVGNVFAPITGDGSTTPENMQWLLSTEWEFEIDLKGVSYAGAAAPNNATLATPASWTSFVSNRKLGPGMIIRAD